MAGVTLQGFEAKRLQDFLEGINFSYREAFGNSINLEPDEVLGQIGGIKAEMLAIIEEKLQFFYDSMFPDKAQGAFLEDVVSITGIKKLKATKGYGELIAYGIEGTVLEPGLIFSVEGNPSAKFETTDEFTIGPGTDEIQTLTFTSEPDAGTWTIVFDGEETGVLQFDDDAATIQAALNALPNLSGVAVAGNYALGFSITFSGDDGEIDQNLIQIGSTSLTDTGVLVGFTIVETTKGVLPNIAITVHAVEKGEINAYAETLTVIETPLPGLDSVINPDDINPGRAIESDTLLRERRKRTLANPGVGTTAAMTANVLLIDEVTNAVTFENDTDAVDAQGRPANSLELIVVGGDEEEIAKTMVLIKAAGTGTVGDIAVQVPDAVGDLKTMRFNRPTQVDIYMIINITTDVTFPANGVEALKQAIVDYASIKHSIGDDVITYKLYCPIKEIQGIIDAEILIGIVDPPVSDDNIIIDETDIANFNTANIVVNEV